MECPRCGTPNKTNAIACRTCGKAFKAYGHPGVNIFTAPEGEVLCETCVYREDNCTLPNYPHATQCTLYRDARQPTPAPVTYRPRRQWSWLVAVLLLVAASLWAALPH
ncbi:hypothetical protein [Anthocerotibacter panamensis]|uniref:hypothetical protein n=1 Tax=Anthocerotibacter panamensis TaxID=2857077 RepID=UPI001C40320E|nr:hypothetical protein [Anthocerotibacter panamensis]